MNKQTHGQTDLSDDYRLLTLFHDYVYIYLIAGFFCEFAYDSLSLIKTHTEDIMQIFCLQ